jgi:hypothetical protein
MTSLCACVFVAALEVTIISTALPTIAAHFASPSGYTWIGTAVRALAERSCGTSSR